MKNTFRIKISKDCKQKFLQLLENNNEYSCIRFDFTPGCSNKNTVEIYLDEFKNGYVIENIDGLFVMYNEKISEYIKTIEVIYDNSTFMVKAEPIKSMQKSSCNKNHCGKCCGHKNCSKCSKN
ncbi:hypothetical protein ACFIJ5_01190 [Haloimpatiens sp. FM7330]|uniref:hypothetical protein n=1 Tax=Haloimpatiens sp. FM7330 TaxID=3298610 RepID=UPI0036355ABB